MKKSFTLLFFALAIHSLPAERMIVTTIHPAAIILREITGTRCRVERLIPPGISPHTYEPRPSDILKMKGAVGTFFISKNLDGWAAGDKKNRSFEMISMLPQNQRLYFSKGDDHHDHAGEHDMDELQSLDPHFWMDPLAVKSILPGLTGALCSIDLEACPFYAANSKRFEGKLVKLDQDIKNKLVASGGKKFILFHPSFRYYFKRYSLIEAGVLEMVAGSEPSARHIANLIKTIQLKDVSAILQEPQFSPVPAKLLSEETGIPVASIDPAGGTSGRETYEELLLYNTNTFAKAK